MEEMSLNGNTYYPKQNVFDGKTLQMHDYVGLLFFIYLSFRSN